MGEQMFSWGHQKRYNDLSSYFRSRFGGRIQKISVDAGFTCPNRDGTKGRGGCSYCNNRSFSPSYCGIEGNVWAQVTEGIQFFARKYHAMRYLAFFQSYTNTYAPVDILRKRFTEALMVEGVIGLVIATRPDCIQEEVLDYLSELNSSCFVLLELGIESHRDETLESVNRGHTFADSEKAIRIASERGLMTCAHLILGLPGETRDDWMDQTAIISRLPVNIIKLHQLQIHRDTKMEAVYRKNPGDFNLFSMDNYIEILIDYIERLRPSIIIDRFVSQAPPELIIAPAWDIKNFEFVAKVEKRLAERGTWQGRLWSG